MMRILAALLALIVSVSVLGAQSETPTAIPEDAIISENGALAIMAPEGWFSAPFFTTGVALSNTETLLAGTGPVIPEAGEVFVQVTYNPRGPFLNEENVLELNDVVSLVFSEFIGADALFTEPEADEINGMPALTASAELDLNGVAARAYVLAVDYEADRSWLLVTAITRVEDFEAILPEVRAIAGSAYFDDSLIPNITRAEEIVSADGELTFDNPDHLFVLVEQYSNVAAATTPALIYSQTFADVGLTDLVFRMSLQPRLFVFSDQQPTLQDVITNVTRDLVPPATPEIIDFDVMGHPAVRMRFSPDPTVFGQIDLMYLFVDFEPLDRVLVMIALSSRGEMSGYEADLLTLIESARLFGEPIPAKE